MVRSVPEWVGKTDDTKVPARVELRVFQKYGGKDYITGQLIRPGDKWELEHIVALCNGGEHRESNFAPILPVNHKAKTKSDLALKKKNARIQKKHTGITRPKGNWGKRPMSGFVSNTRDVNEDLNGDVVARGAEQ